MLGYMMSFMVLDSSIFRALGVWVYVFSFSVLLSIVFFFNKVAFLCFVVYRLHLSFMIIQFTFSFFRFIHFGFCGLWYRTPYNANLGCIRHPENVIPRNFSDGKLLVVRCIRYVSLEWKSSVGECLLIGHSPSQLIIHRRWLCWLTQAISNKQSDCIIYENAFSLKSAQSQ